ncbi:guanine nucleotide exchange factor [Podospora australis]|uniref:Guanine nucleotide exchange factor n=1 Tax=Podospora australis TaxID=1536484 RepID=A0AAN6X2S7_9PEZI|nr:guanine nucleotide exchange factor [Podospora australis]
MASSPSFGRLTGPAKLKAVKDIVDQLTDDLKTDGLQPQKREALLEELKIYGRDPNFADPIFTQEGIRTLAKHAFNSSSANTSRGALRVLCNALLLKPSARQIFVSTGYDAKACSKLQNDDNSDDEFLLCRLLLLSTYNTDIDLPKLIGEYQLAEALVMHLQRHAKRYSPNSASKARVNPMDDMAMAETLKLLFNVTQFCPNQLAPFEPAIPSIVTILTNHDLPSPQSKTPLDPPFGPLLNTLLNLKLSTDAAKESLFPSSSPTVVSDRLIKLLALSIKAYTNPNLEQIVTPVVCALTVIYEHAPAVVRKAVQTALLPSEEDRQDVLGKADTLPSRLLRNWTNAEAPELGKAISHLYFDLSDRVPNKFVKNVGYGYASGFLFQNGIEIKPDSLSGNEVEGSDGVREINRPVNPITGQFLDTEKPVEVPEMTDEEKEREAERLFVLFERLKKTGIIDVVNPVEKAMQEGRFEELPDDDKSD